MKTRMGFRTDKSQSDETQDVLWIAREADGAAVYRLSFGNTIRVNVLHGISIGKPFECEAGQEIERLGVLQQLASGCDRYDLKYSENQIVALIIPLTKTFFSDLSVLEIASTRDSVHQCTSGAPWEAIAQRVVGTLWCWETSTIGHKWLNFSTASMDLLKTLHGQEMVDSRIQSHFIDNRYTSLNSSLVKGLHGLR